MRRTDREVTDRLEIYDILRRCETLRVAMNGDGAPYVVPVSFGSEMVGDTAVVYFHCAAEGLKPRLLASDPRVCVEGDILIGIERTDHGITARYESVIGFGECRLIDDIDEAKRGLRRIVEHYGHGDYPLDGCVDLRRTQVWKIVLREWSGKRNLPTGSR